MLNSQTLKRPGTGPSAYLITFTCYGTRIHGDLDGSVDRYHNLWRTPMLEANSRRTRFERRLLKYDPVTLSRSSKRGRAEVFCLCGVSLGGGGGY